MSREIDKPALRPSSGAGGSLHQSNLFQDYTAAFVQRIPRYCVKTKNGWRSRSKSLSDKAVQAHLSQKYAVGGLGPWYPGFAILDFDNVPKRLVDDVRTELGLDDSNSMLCSSESPNSYHLLIRPNYNGKPPTMKLLHLVLDPFGKFHNIEIFPQANRTIRLPFGKGQDCLDYKYQYLNTWEDQLYWFNKLDEKELEAVKLHQLSLDLKPRQQAKIEGISAYKDGEGYLNHGLQAPSTRNQAQFCILYYLWRNNVDLQVAVKMVWQWIRTMHNGFSKDFLRYPQRVKEEIQRQGAHIWDKYDRSSVYPDSTHNTFHGYISKPDLFEIVDATGGSLPRSRFLFNLVKYTYPRRHKTFVPVHTAKLRSWGSWRTSQKYLDELDQKGIARRGKSYQVGKFSKPIKLNWKFKDSGKAILFEGRSVDTFDKTVRLVYKPAEFSQKLQAVGVKRTTAIEQVKTVFGSTG